jgi:molybdopterin molybdotransferase
MISDYNSTAISVETALQRIEQQIQPIQNHEQVSLHEALNRVLAQNVYSSVNVPPHANSAMDGYAVRSADLISQTETCLIVVGTSFAGKPYTQSVPTGHCVRIFTGAFLPPDTDTVIMQEHVTVQNDTIVFKSDQKAGQHVRTVGEDVKIGQQVLSVGKQLRPADLGLLASLGIAKVMVIRLLQVAILSTGDELCTLEKTPQFGQIYDSNRYTLHGMLTRLGVKVIDMGIIPDQPQMIENAFLAATQYDAIITSGGVSVGEADYVTDVLRKIGAVNFWKIAMKPGHPLTFGKIQAVPFFGLPGNPVSVMATFYQFVQPALQRLMGQNKTPPLRLKVRCISPLKKSPGRLEFQRGILETDEQGQLVVSSTGQQGSGILSSMSRANCFIVLPVTCGNVPAGSEVIVEPLTCL